MGASMVRYPIFVFLALQLCLAGCSAQQIARFENKVGAQRCVKDRGLAEGTVEHQRCVNAYAAAAQSERMEAQAALLNVAGASAEVWSAEQQGRANAQSNVPPPGYNTYTLRAQWWDAGNRMCQYADGSILNAGSATCPSKTTGPR